MVDYLLYLHVTQLRALMLSPAFDRPGCHASSPSHPLISHASRSRNPDRETLSFTRWSLTPLAGCWNIIHWDLCRLVGVRSIGGDSWAVGMQIDYPLLFLLIPARRSLHHSAIAPCCFEKLVVPRIKSPDLKLRFGPWLGNIRPAIVTIRSFQPYYIPV